MTAEDLSKLTKSVSNAKPVISLADLRSSCDDPVLKECFEIFLSSALEYTETVCEMQREALNADGAITETLRDIDVSRKRKHDALISNIDILSRMLGRRGKQNAWRSELGDNRAAMGKFALIVSFEHLIVQAIDG